MALSTSAAIFYIISKISVFYRLCGFYWNGCLFSEPPADWGAVSREASVCRILHGRHPLPRHVLCFPHHVLPLGGGRQALQQVRFFTNNFRPNPKLNILVPLRLDYCGIAMLIMGSFVPWLYYGFYCDFQPKVIYLSVTILLGISSIVVSLWDKFSEPKYRSLRAGACFVFCFRCDPTAMRFFQGFSWLSVWVEWFRPCTMPWPTAGSTPSRRPPSAGSSSWAAYTFWAPCSMPSASQSASSQANVIMWYVWNCIFGKN